MEKLLCAPDMDEDLYAALLDALRLRLRDREAPVRVQAVLCLAKLSPDEPLAALEDAHPDVRKAVLYVTDQVDPLASRIRDVDINTRKMVCAKLATKQLDQIQDRHTRKQALSACKDREEAVRKVAGKMVAHWIGKDSLEEFLGHFDLLSQSEEAQTAVEAALRARPELAAEITFDGR